MKKLLKAIALFFLMGVCFLAGWRVMPKAWPWMKETVVYSLFPVLKPTPAPVVTPEPYHPVSTAQLDDAVSPDDSLIYYFYKDYCPYCKNLEPLTANLPQSIHLPDGRESRVKFVCIDKMQMEEMVLQVYADYAIPGERQFVPAIMIGDRYLLGAEEIMAQLYPALLNGEGIHTPLLNGRERTE